MIGYGNEYEESVIVIIDGYAGPCLRVHNILGFLALCQQSYIIFFTVMPSINNFSVGGGLILFQLLYIFVPLHAL